MASAPNRMMDAARAPCISSLPFPPLILSHSPLFSPALYLCLESGGSLVQPPDVVQLRHLSYLLGTDTIFTLTSYWARFFFHSSSIPLFYFHLVPPRCGLHWHSLLLYPQEHSVHCHCKANAWDSLKQTASILCRSPICG